MRIFVNGNEQDVPEGTTVAELVQLLGITGPVAVERNKDVVTRKEHPTTTLAAGDLVEVVHFVGGG